MLLRMSPVPSTHHSAVCPGLETVTCSVDLTDVGYPACEWRSSGTMTLYAEQQRITCNRCGDTEPIPLGLVRIDADEETIRQAMADRWTVRDTMDLCPVCSLT